MNKKNFPYIAVALGLLLLLIVMKGSERVDDGKTVLPLLTLLTMCEFGGIVTTIGTYFGGKQIISQRFDLVYSLATISCGVLCAYFLITGIQLWPQ